MRASLLSFCLLLVALPASGQPTNESRATELRDEARDLTEQGRFQSAYVAFRLAVELTEDPEAWLELAEMADRLRVDGIALSAYSTFLERAPRSPRRVEVAARVRVLTDLINGRRFVPAEDARSLDFLGRDGEAVPDPPSPSGDELVRNVLVDWQGQPLVIRRSSTLQLAAWEHESSDTHVLEAAPSGPTGLARFLSAP